MLLVGTVPVPDGESDPAGGWPGPGNHYPPVPQLLGQHALHLQRPVQARQHSGSRALYNIITNKTTNFVFKKKKQDYLNIL